MSDSTEVLKGELKSAQEEIERLHAACEKRGFNSRETKDIFGRTFPLADDAEHKATGLYVTNFSQPHMRAMSGSSAWRLQAVRPGGAAGSCTRGSR